MSEKFKKFMNKDVEIEITSPDKENVEIFKFKPLNVDEFTRMAGISEKIEYEKDKDGKTLKDEKGEPVTKPLDSKTTKEMMELYCDIVERSYPREEKESEKQYRDDIENFVITNLNKFPDILAKLGPTKLDDKQKTAMDKIKALQNMTPAHG